MGRTFAACALVCLFGCGPKNRAAENTASGESTIKTPATVEEAARVLDLSTFPLMDGAQPPGSREVSNLLYLATGGVRTAFDFHRQVLTAQGWKELPNPSVSDQSASGMFARSGFVLSLSVSQNSPAGTLVMLQNNGNIKPGQLPAPPGAKPVYAGDATAMYESDTAVPATADTCRQLFLQHGWVAYGSAGDSAYYKQNAILATVSSAPARGGKTMIQYSTELMSADIPMPPQAEGAGYADQPPQLDFTTTATQDAIVDFYRKTLAAAGWQSTLDHTAEVDDKATMIFRNAAKDMITLSFYGVSGGKMPVQVGFQSGAKIAERDRIMKERAPALRAAAEAEAAREAAREAAAKVVPKVPVTLPEGATEVKEEKESIKFTVAKGKAKAAAENLRAQFRAAGWKEDTASLTPMSGVVLFSKDGQSVNLTYSDTGFLPTEVSLSSMRAELERR